MGGMNWDRAARQERVRRSNRDYDDAYLDQLERMGRLNGGVNYDPPGRPTSVAPSRLDPNLLRAVLLRLPEKTRAMLLSLERGNTGFPLREFLAGRDTVDELSGKSKGATAFLHVLPLADDATLRALAPAVRHEDLARARWAVATYLERNRKHEASSPFKFRGEER